ncbi:uncharacterized protein RAG0_07692 [Rhynchosporium agropyri]|uniref:Uncharacterized protein n=1 Tax=Rhynchosporium agropyri TaxID=914238 RepID=A0A1E1KMQ4_9HELO|nr:uncharacterized protein RAG0_07692 [Rhynchosporium agropyri]
MASLAVFVLKSIIKREISWTSVLLEDEDSHIAISALSLTTKRRKRKEKIPRGRITSSRSRAREIRERCRCKIRVLAASNDCLIREAQCECHRSEERKEHWNHDELVPATGTIKPPSPVPFSSDIHFPMISTGDM